MNEDIEIFAIMEDIEEFAGQLSGRLSDDDERTIRMAKRYKPTLKRIKTQLYDLWMGLEE